MKIQVTLLSALILLGVSSPSLATGPTSGKGCNQGHAGYGLYHYSREEDGTEHEDRIGDCPSEAPQPAPTPTPVPSPSPSPSPSPQPILSGPKVDVNNTQSQVSNNSNVNSSSSGSDSKSSSDSSASAVGHGGKASASSTSGNSSALAGTTGASTSGSIVNSNNYQRGYRAPAGFLPVPLYRGVWNLGVTGNVDQDGYSVGIGVTTAIGAPSYNEVREFDIRQAEAGRPIYQVDNSNTTNNTGASSLPVQEVQKPAPVVPVETFCEKKGKGWSDSAECSGKG
jgi:hypothetical protein